MNNVGSTTLLHPVFNNLEQVTIFRRVCNKIIQGWQVSNRIQKLNHQKIQQKYVNSLKKLTQYQQKYFLNIHRVFFVFKLH